MELSGLEYECTRFCMLFITPHSCVFFKSPTITRIIMIRPLNVKDIIKSDLCMFGVSAPILCRILSSIQKISYV